MEVTSWQHTLQDNEVMEVISSIVSFPTKSNSLLWPQYAARSDNMGRLHSRRTLHFWALVIIIIKVVLGDSENYFITIYICDENFWISKCPRLMLLLKIVIQCQRSYLNKAIYPAGQGRKQASTDIHSWCWTWSLVLEGHNLSNIFNFCPNAPGMHMTTKL